MPTKIQWADETWNPISGCTPVSGGCDNCYARRMAARLAGRFGYPADDPFQVTFHPDKLDQPSRWRKPRRIFVCSMGDFFHREVTETQRIQILAAMLKSPQHTYTLLTKRAGTMAKWWDWMFDPPPNLWQGVTVENQKRADERIPKLLGTPAAVKFVSVEPMLGPVDFGPMATYPSYGLDWVILGCESGPKRRPCSLRWVQRALAECHDRRLPVFVKQLDIDGKVTSDPADWPVWARRQEFPDTRALKER